MNRRDFTTQVLAGAIGIGSLRAEVAEDAEGYLEPSRRLPIRKYDVVVAGGGTAGVIAALAAARQGARTALVEAKGYTGGTAVEGGTALHSFYNLWKAFPGVEKRQIVRGIPEQLIQRLVKGGGSSGHAEMELGYDYDSTCTAIDTEIYKLTSMEMLEEAGVHLCLNTLLTGAATSGGRIQGAIVNSRSGRELLAARCFVDCTAYGDLAAFAGARYTEPNDYDVCNSVGIGNVDIDKYYEFLKSHGTVGQLARGLRSGKSNQIVRAGSEAAKLPPEMAAEVKSLGISMITTTVHDNYLMFIKCNMRLDKSPTDRDTVAKAEVEIRRRMAKAVDLFRHHVPGCREAFMARTSPSLCIRRGRLIACDYDITHEDVIQGRHFDDDTFVYGFHDMAPRLQIANGGTYGIPYRALLASGVENLLVAGMMITSDHRAHMSTRNTVSCMGQGQAAGTAAALCAAGNLGTRDLEYSQLRQALVTGGVYFSET
jgi:hypothetical protein